MRIEWDQAKNKANRHKHGIDFETAQLVFDDPCCITFVERVWTGRNAGTLLAQLKTSSSFAVVHTYRVEASDEVIRIISARPATRRERKVYAQTIA